MIDAKQRWGTRVMQRSRSVAYRSASSGDYDTSGWKPLLRVQSSCASLITTISFTCSLFFGLIVVSIDLRKHHSVLLVYVSLPFYLHLFNFPVSAV